MSELKPCPFCGAKDERLEQAFTRATDDFAYWSVECLDCACEIASDASQAEADAAWNTRALPAGEATDLRDSARWLVDRVSHHGDHAVVDQDHIDGLRDAVNAFDAAYPPSPAIALATLSTPPAPLKE